MIPSNRLVNQYSRSRTFTEGWVTRLGRLFIYTHVVAVLGGIQETLTLSPTS